MTLVFFDNASIEITEEMSVVIRRALNRNLNGGEQLNEINRIQIKRSDVLTLEGNTWLNDEVYLAHLSLAYSYLLRVSLYFQY